MRSANGTKKYLNFGYIRKGTKKYRKALRQCRRNGGFDNSELWNLDATFGKFMYDRNYTDLKDYRKLFFNWYNDIRDEADDILYNIKDPDEREKAWQKLKIDTENTCREISLIIANESEISSACRKFLIPRLEVFKKKIHGFPSSYGNEENWLNFISTTIEEIKNNNFENFLINIREFWD